MAKKQKVGDILRNINLETPLVKHATESPNAYKMFMDFVQSDGLLTMATIAKKHDASLSYVERMCSTQKWRQRLEIYKNNRLSAGMVIPKDEESAAMQAEGVDGKDMVDLTISSMKDVSEETYFAMTGYYDKVKRLADAAIENFDLQSVSSAADLKQLLSLLESLAEARQESADQLFGLEQLSSAVRDLKRKQK